MSLFYIDFTVDAFGTLDLVPEGAKLAIMWGFCKHLLLFLVRYLVPFKAAKPPKFDVIQGQESTKKIDGVTSEDMEQYNNYTKEKKEHGKWVDKVTILGLTTLFHGGMIVVGSMVTWDHPAWTNTKLFTSPTRLTEFEAFYFLIEVAWYMERFISDPFLNKRSDLLVSLIHHFVTVFLIFLTTHHGYCLWGMFIMYIHDISDFYLMAAKTCRSLCLEPFDDILFGTFVISWFYTRLYTYFRYIIYTVFTAFPQYSPCSTIGLRFGQGGLVCLGLLHINWTLYIVKACQKTFLGKGRKVHDIREKQE